jgi:hypothetical protein
LAHVLAVLPWVAVSAGAGGGGRPARCEEGRVLVVGAGLAGLGAADALRRHGCDVTVLEAGLLPGGTHTRRTARPPPPPAHSRCAPLADSVLGFRFLLFQSPHQASTEGAEGPSLTTAGWAGLVIRVFPCGSQGGPQPWRCVLPTYCCG